MAALKEKSGILDGSSSKRRKLINHWSLFYPQPALDELLRMFKFLRYAMVPLPFLFAIALTGFLANFHLFKKDLLQVSLTFNFIQHTIYILFTINLISAIVRGCVARHFNIPTTSFGLMLAFGIIPEFDIRMEITEIVDKKAKMWLLSAAILTRIFLASLGIILWLVTRPRGTRLPILFAALAWYSIFGLVIMANPLLGGDSARLLSSILNIPNILGKAYRSLRYLFWVPPAVISKYNRNNLALRFYAFSSLLCIVFLVGFIGHHLAHWLSLNYPRLEGIVILVLASYIFLWFRFIRKKVAELKNPLKAKPIKSKNPAKRILLGWALYMMVMAIICLMFLPYQYVVKGDVEILPGFCQELYPEEKGIIDKIYFGGGEWVKEGTLIAEMDNYKHQKDVEITRIAIKKKLEEINFLLTTPLSEKVDVAKQQLLASTLKLHYSRKDYQRTEALYQMDIFSLAAYLDAEKKMELNTCSVAEKQAGMLLLQEKVNQHEIESKKYQLAFLERELRYYQERLERTRLRMPIDGRIVTMNLKNLEKKYLDEAQPLVEIEDTRRVQIQILISESDADQVRVGNHVVFKTPNNEATTITTEVASIFPVTESTDNATVLKIVCMVPNADGMLETGMSIYAKVQGQRMFLIQYLTRTLVRFFQIEFWAWLP